MGFSRREFTLSAPKSTTCLTTYRRVSKKALRICYCQFPYLKQLTSVNKTITLGFLSCSCLSQGTEFLHWHLTTSYNSMHEKNRSDSKFNAYCWRERRRKGGWKEGRKEKIKARKAESIKRKKSDISFQMDYLSLALFLTTGTHFSLFLREMSALEII